MSVELWQKEVDPQETLGRPRCALEKGIHVPAAEHSLPETVTGPPQAVSGGEKEKGQRKKPK